MYVKILKQKTLFYYFKIISIKKKKINILGPYGNYSYSVFTKKINKNYYFYPIISIKKILNIKKYIFPIENNNGGLVNDSINLLFNNNFFYNFVLIININHKIFFLNNKKKIFLHNQSLKQTNYNLYLKFIKLKILKTFSNTIINSGINICNFSTKNVLTLSIKSIFLKNNIINKTKFIIINNSFNKKILISFFININFFFIFKIIKNIVNIYVKKKTFYIEIFFLSFRTVIFIMKLFKKKINIKFKSFHSIL
ncbi:prephenate dehydratase domain-containing protein [Candidatus Carsonella ruddii]|uniref:Putative prephenate dehydratase n=1 Tax=Candidatus Carsonella ruddii PC isolate NHV TaxID=1202540 RepID=J3TWH2_CARRU|nr:prephenate dehydratase domain-containing protein [Candidatus Carsonella ruddii]AFP84275.1 putative prephenate dehydratase [Candidatus Carsonella ruddii PC isolate NHV]